MGKNILILIFVFVSVSVFAQINGNEKITINDNGYNRKITLDTLLPFYNPIRTATGNVAIFDSLINVNLNVKSLQIGGGDNKNAIYSKKLFYSGTGITNYTQRIIAEIRPTSGINYAFAASSDAANYITTLDNQSGSWVSATIGTATALDGRANVLAGGDFSARYTGAKTTVVGCSAYGVRSDVRVSTGYLNHAMAYKANPPILTNGATVGNVWGLYIADVDVIGAADGAAINIEGNGIRNSIDFGAARLYENIDTFYVDINSVGVLSVNQNNVNVKKVLNADLGINISDFAKLEILTSYPATPINGMVICRQDGALQRIECYLNGVWVTIASN